MIWIWIAFIAAKSEALSSAVTKAKNVVTPTGPQRLWSGRRVGVNRMPGCEWDCPRSQGPG